MAVFPLLISQLLHQIAGPLHPLPAALLQALDDPVNLGWTMQTFQGQMNPEVQEELPLPFSASLDVALQTI